MFGEQLLSTNGLKPGYLVLVRQGNLTPAEYRNNPMISSYRIQTIENDGRITLVGNGACAYKISIFVDGEDTEREPRGHPLTKIFK